MEAYYDYAPREAKTSIDAIFGGGRYPLGDVPFLHTIRTEVRQAATYLCPHRARDHLGKHYAHRARPIFEYLSAIISSEEDAVMCQIMEIVNRPPNMHGVRRIDLRGKTLNRRHQRKGRVRRSREDARATDSSEAVGIDSLHLGRVRGCDYMGKDGRFWRIKSRGSTCHTWRSFVAPV